jgi:hypothetical protein
MKAILSRLSGNGLTIVIVLKRELDDFHLTNGTRYLLGIDLQIFYDYKIIQFYYHSQFDCGRKSEYLGKNTDILYICMTLTNFINFDGIKYTLTSVKPTNRSGNVYHLSNENHPTPFLT